MSDAPAPWERQRGESAKAYEAFRTYLDLGPSRTLTDAARKLHKNRTTIGQWSARWRWLERIADWDSELARRALEDEAQRWREMNERHARVGQYLIAQAMKRLVGAEESGIRPLDLNALGAADVVRLIEAGIKAERAARAPSAPQQVDLGQVRLEAIAIAVRGGVHPDVAAAEFDRIMAEERLTRSSR